MKTTNKKHIESNYAVQIHISAANSCQQYHSYGWNFEHKIDRTRKEPFCDTCQNTKLQNTKGMSFCSIQFDPHNHQIPFLTLKRDQRSEIQKCYDLHSKHLILKRSRARLERQLRGKSTCCSCRRPSFGFQQPCCAQNHLYLQFQGIHYPF